MESYRFKTIAIIIATFIISYLTISCSSDEPEIDTNDETQSTQDLELERKLSGTSWKYDYMISYNDGIKKTFQYDKVTFLSNKSVNHYILLLPEEYPGIILVNPNLSFSGEWHVKDGKLLDWIKNDSNRGILMDRYGADYLNGCIISSLTTTEMILTGGYGSKYRLVSIPNESGSGNTNSQSSESLYFTNFTFTASTSSVTVKFFTNVKATSATIKYGKNSATSSVSTTIIDKQISATITGLTKGTKYYVKCIARNANGSVTSDEYPVITNY